MEKAQRAKFKDSKQFTLGGESKLILPKNKIISEENYEKFLAEKQKAYEQEVERERQRKENLMKAYDEQYANFISDNSYLSNYDQFTFLKGEVLVRIFRVIEKKLTNNMTEGGLYIPDEAQEGFSRITSYAKVIKVGNVSSDLSNQIKPGDIVKLSDYISGTKPNPDYINASMAMNERGPGVDPSRVPNPDDIPRFVTNLIDWEQYCFRLKVTEYTENDSLTYLLPQSFIFAKVNV